MNMLVTYWHLVRLSMVLMAMAAVVTGYRLSSTSGTYAVLAAGVIAIGCITAAGFVLNAITDIDRDRINAPARPLSKNAISLQQARLVTVLLFSAGLAASVWLPAPAAGCIVVLVILLGVYKLVKEKTGWGANVLTAAMCSICFLVGGFAGDAPGLSWVAAVAVLPLITARESAKDIHDVRGDQSVGLTTLPMQLSAKNVRLLIVLLGVLTAILALLPAVLHLLTPYYAACMGLGIALLTYATIRLVARPLAPNAVSFYISASKGAMCLGILAFLIGV